VSTPQSGSGIDTGSHRVAAAHSDSILAVLAVRVGESLLQRRLRAVAVESCTGGYVAKLLTDVAGSSQWFESGYVCYSNEAKRRDLGVRAETLHLHGAVSEDTAREMAEGALRVTGVDRAIAVTGVAGPDGGSARHPVGDVWFALARRSTGVTDVHAVHRRFTGDRDAVRRQAAAVAMELLLEP
jgi:nicotinamide-nucleotide amidase